MRNSEHDKEHDNFSVTILVISKNGKNILSGCGHDCSELFFSNPRTLVRIFGRDYHLHPDYLSDMRIFWSLIFAVALVGCEQKQLSVTEADTEISNEATREELREALAELLITTTGGEVESENRLIDIRVDLESETSPGRAQLLASDLAKEEGRLKEAEKARSDAFKAWIDVDIGDPFKGPEMPVVEGEPDYDLAIRAWRRKIGVLSNKGVDRDYEELDRLLSFRLEQVMKEFSE